MLCLFKGWRRFLAVSVFLLFSACGGSSSSSEGSNQSSNDDPGNKITLVADAGSDQIVVANSRVILDATRSESNDDSPIDYYWVQVSGEVVSFDSATSAQPSFTAPSVTTTTILVFELQVSNGPDLSKKDQVSITITAQSVSCFNSQWNPGDFETVYEVGPNQNYKTPSDVPWESLTQSTLVMIYGKDQPYYDKWVINVEATEQNPVVVLGVPENGQLPIISGQNATTRTELDYWNENRAVIKVGGSSKPNSDHANHIIIECLDIRSAKPEYSFTDDQGNEQSYSSNAAAITIEQGENITIRRCELHDAGNGLFTTSFTSNILVSSNYIHDNGIVGQPYEHNSYTESRGIVFEYNRYGSLCTGCSGNNLKDRSMGTVIRYNWIENGNRQLDLVDTGHSEFSAHSDYRKTFVYGNLLIEANGEGNSQIIHYGGDSGNTSMYRKGTLYLYHNTIISTRAGNTTLINLSTNDETLDAKNNIIYTTAGGSLLAMAASDGQLSLSNNWLPTGWRNSHSMFNGNVVSNNNIEGLDPSFKNMTENDFKLMDNSAALNASGVLPSGASQHPITSEYVPHQSNQLRNEGVSGTLGAYSF